MDTVSTKINTAKSGDKFIIRKARRDDLDDVLAMIQVCFSIHICRL